MYLYGEKGEQRTTLHALVDAIADHAAKSTENKQKLQKAVNTYFIAETKDNNPKGKHNFKYNLFDIALAYNDEYAVRKLLDIGIDLSSAEGNILYRVLTQSKLNINIVEAILLAATPENASKTHKYRIKDTINAGSKITQDQIDKFFLKLLNENQYKLTEASKCALLKELVTAWVDQKSIGAPNKEQVDQTVSNCMEATSSSEVLKYIEVLANLLNTREPDYNGFIEARYTEKIWQVGQHVYNLFFHEKVKEYPTEVLPENFFVLY